MGVLTYSACVIMINVKLQIIEQHYLAMTVASCCVIMIGGWFLWNIIFSVVYGKNRLYNVRDGLLERFGQNPLWWLTLIIAVSCCKLSVIKRRVRRLT
jgi:phospholipid-translocating ATPase